MGGMGVVGCLDSLCTSYMKALEHDAEALAAQRQSLNAAEESLRLVPFGCLCLNYSFDYFIQHQDVNKILGIFDGHYIV